MNVPTARVRRFLVLGLIVIVCVGLAAYMSGWHFAGERTWDEVEYTVKEARDERSDKSPLDRLLDEPFVPGDAARRRFIERLTTILQEPEGRGPEDAPNVADHNAEDDSRLSR